MKNKVLKFFLAVVCASGVAYCTDPHRVEGVADKRPVMLKKLDGRWTASGHVMGNPVVYAVSVEPVLNAAFSCIHMTDTNSPPRYEALIYTGYDSIAGQLYAHWLDSFGAAASIPYGTGQLTASGMELSFPYRESPFRDTFTYDETDNSWKLLIESYSDATSSWSEFASYKLSRQN